MSELQSLGQQYPKQKAQKVASLPPAHYFGIKVYAENYVLEYFLEKTDIQHRPCGVLGVLDSEELVRLLCTCASCSSFKKPKAKKATQTLKLYSFNSTVNSTSYLKPCLPSTGAGLGLVVGYKRN